jgi:hypothetical protein
MILSGSSNECASFALYLDHTEEGIRQNPAAPFFFMGRDKTHYRE